MLIFNSLIASSETFQLSPNLRVIGYSNFYCCTGHNSFSVCFYVMPKLPECIWVGLGRRRGLVWFFFRTCTYLKECFCFLLWFLTNNISDHAPSHYCFYLYSLHLLCRTSQFYFFPVNHIVFCMQTLHRTEKNLTKCPPQPITELWFTCETVAVTWPCLGSVFASPCPVLAEESPAEICWLLSKKSLSTTSWKAQKENLCI